MGIERVFRTRNGAVHLTEKEAEREEAQLELRDRVSDLYDKVLQSSDSPRSVILRYLIDNASDLRLLLAMVGEPPQEKAGRLEEPFEIFETRVIGAFEQ